MTNYRHRIFQCQRPTCRFRFPVGGTNLADLRCPRCGASATVSSPPYDDQPIGPAALRPSGPVVEAVLDNVRSALNVGSMFRTADAAGVRHLHLCGITPTPRNHKLAKTALGAETSVPWTYHHDGARAARLLRGQGLRLWALEGGPTSRSLFETTILSSDHPFALVVGNEISGVDPAILGECERIAHIPMEGIKRSLNAAVAFGIAAYYLRHLCTVEINRPLVAEPPRYDERHLEED